MRESTKSLSHSAGCVYLYSARFWAWQTHVSSVCILTAKDWTCFSGFGWKVNPGVTFIVNGSSGHLICGWVWRSTQGHCSPSHHPDCAVYVFVYVSAHLYVSVIRCRFLCTSSPALLLCSSVTLSILPWNTVLRVLFCVLCNVLLLLLHY